MCLRHNLQLYLRCVHLFKMLVGVYLLVYGCVLCADVSVQQAFGSDMLGIGIVIVFLGVLKPANVLMGHYGSAKHNKCALLIVIMFDGVAGVVQFSLGLTLLTRGTSTYDAHLRKACSRSVLTAGTTSRGDCDRYWRDSRTAGIRLAWMGTYYRGARQKDNAQSKVLEQIEEFAECCGFGPPEACDDVSNDGNFPKHFETQSFLGKDMVKERYRCSSDYDCTSSTAASDDDILASSFCWYPVEDGVCEHYAADDIAKAHPLGCRYDWGLGSCLDETVTAGSKGCAWHFEEIMNDKIHGHGIAFLVFLILEFTSIFSACCYCWKRKNTDVLPINYIFDEPFDPYKDGKLTAAGGAAAGKSSSGAAATTSDQEEESNNHHRNDD